MSLYSIKMRASQKNKHISGSEKIISYDHIGSYANQLMQRGLNHPKGSPDLLNIKIEKIENNNILYLDALPVCTIEVDNYRMGIEEIRKFLNSLNLENADKIVNFLSKTYSMRGAILLDVDTLERLEPDRERGIRATYMDAERTNNNVSVNGKNHYAEAIVLATKVAYAPNIIGEICISDDPDYVTGYVASKSSGYKRITKMKEQGSENGGRIFLYQGSKNDVAETISFLEKQPVIVRNVQPLYMDKRPTDKFKFIGDELIDMRQNNLYRSMKTIQSGQSSTVIYNGREMLMMASNDYLDMSSVDEVKKYAASVLEKYGTGSGGSRLTTGNTVIHEMLENKIAEFKNTESALVFNTGYIANLATISSLMGKNDVIFSDELNHASIIDGCRLSGAKIVVYRHNDMEDLERKITVNPCRKGLIVSDAVFSMDGDILNLPEFVRIADKYNLLSMIDEAHSTGVIGRTGRGIVEYYNYICEPDIIMGTLSKAVGSEGGFVCGKNKLIEYLKNKARGFIFSTSLSPVTMATSLKSFEVIEKNPELVTALHDNVRFFCEYMKQKGFNIHSETAIIPIIIGDEKKAMEISEWLFEQGYFISAIRYPTVKKQSARLRIALMATHTPEQLKEAADSIINILRQKEVFI
ncbi:MAG: 8-amino-7-oxononanoate synthase [Lachnospiraceae bacterium]|nr:8-amino-7-oxononanoate synthase [Lachnospiraceae bacterium]